MTQNQSNAPSRDDVLVAFEQACPVPTAAQIFDWCTQYPQFAEDIRQHAAISRDWAARGETCPVADDERLLARGFSRVLNHIYEAQQRTPAPAAQAPQTFQQIVAAHQTDVPRLSAELDIDRVVLSELFNGRMVGSVGKLATALIQRLGLSRDSFDQARGLALSSPKLGLAKATGIPTVQHRTYEEAIRASNMTDDRKRYWLGEA